MGGFIDEIHEEIVTEAECADETQLSKERTDMLRGWADAYATQAAEIARLQAASVEGLVEAVKGLLTKPKLIEPPNGDMWTAGARYGVKAALAEIERLKGVIEGASVFADRHGFYDESDRLRAALAADEKGE